MKINGIQQHPFEYISCIQNATFFRFLLFLILFLAGSTTSFAQGITTFNYTVIDTLNYGSISYRAVDLVGNYFVQSSGFGLDGLKGYNMITRITNNGDIVSKKMNYSELYMIKPGVLVTDGVNLISSYSKIYMNPVSSNEFAKIEVAKLNIQYDTLWKYTFQQSEYADEVAAIIISETDQSIIIVGSRTYPDSLAINELDGFFLKLSDGGDSLDFKTYENGANLYFLSATLIDNNIYVGGSGYSDGSQYDGVLYKLNGAGDVIDHDVYPNHYNLRVAAYSGGEYLLSGTPSNMNNLRSRLILCDTNGVEIWNRLHSFESTVFDQYYSRRLENGDIVSVGLIGLGSSPDGNAGFISRSDQSGELRWFRRYNYNMYTDFFLDVLETNDGGLLVNGSARDTGAGDGSNLWLVKLDSMGCLEPNCWVGLESVEPNAIGVSLFPNPANDWLNIKLHNPSQAITLELFDVSGQRVMHTQLFAPLEAIQVRHLAIGLYFAKFTLNNGSSITERVVLAR